MVYVQLMPIHSCFQSETDEDNEFESIHFLDEDSVMFKKALRWSGAALALAVVAGISWHIIYKTRRRNQGKFINKVYILEEE